LQVIVQGNDVDKAMKHLKRKLQMDGLFAEMKKRKHYEKPSVKRKRKQQNAERRRRKAMRSRDARRGPER
jgi:small subunit ribosomal protein S21